jgi:hypothetical protein
MSFVLLAMYTKDTLDLLLPFLLSFLLQDNSQTIRTDTLTVSCVISASPTCPPSPPSVPHQAVPRDLLSRVGSLLDNPNYSDVSLLSLPPSLPLVCMQAGTLLDLSPGRVYNRQRRRLEEGPTIDLRQQDDA